MAKIIDQDLMDLSYRLKESIKALRIDVSTMYEVHAYLVQSASPVSVRATDLLDKYDVAAYSEDTKRAVAVAERMVGLLEGLSRSLDIEPPKTVNTEGLLPSPQSPSFVLDRDERQTVLKLASEMRACVVGSDFFDHAHRVRLIKRISAIEAEVHKPKGLFDVVLGGLNDAGEAFGKFGDDVKPIVERMKEIAQITRRKSDDYEALPAPEEQKRLPAPDASEE